MTSRPFGSFTDASVDRPGGNFIETMLRLAKEKGEVWVVADQMMSPTSTYDAAEAIIDLVVTKPAPGTSSILGPRLGSNLRSAS
jgi:dTDP-4-dehydrorhamnose reductase